MTCPDAFSAIRQGDSHAPPSAIPRYRALYEALISKKMEVRALPDSAFGLIDGKAGVVRRAEGSGLLSSAASMKELQPVLMGMQIRVFLGLGKIQARIVLARRRSAFPMPSAFPSVQAHRWYRTAGITRW